MATTTIYTTKDASMFKNGDGWSGWDLHHPVGINSNGNIWRSLVYFPINFTGWTGLNSATLWLRGHKVSGVSHVFSNATRTLNVTRMQNDWGEGTNRGENLWSGNETWNWSNRATAYTGASQQTTISGGITHGNWYSVDITPIVQAWFSGSPNYGMLLSASTEASGNIGLEFYSRDSGSGFRPYVVIDYSTNTGPSAPTGLYPTSDALINSLTPSLSGTHSDPDPLPDYMTAYQIQFYADDGTTLIWDSGTLLINTEPSPAARTAQFSKVYSGPAIVGNTFYKWKARTRDTASNWGPYSSLQRFKTNTPPNTPAVSVSEAQPLRTLTPTMNITHSDNDVGDTQMYGYRVILETWQGTSVWDSGDIDTSGAPVTVKSFTYSGPALTWQNSYRIRARTKDINGVWGTYSGNYYFSTWTTYRPINLDPSAGEVISGLVPTFYGERGNTNDTITSYQILVYASDNVTLIWDSGSLSTGIVNGAAFTKAYAGTALSYGTLYYWTVRVTSTIGGTSEYQDRVYFNTPADATVPTQNLPTPNNSPTNNNVSSLTPTFTGSRSSAFTNYQIELYPSTATSGNLGTPIWDSGNLSQASSTSFSKLYNGPALSWATTYKWRVRVGAPTLGAYTGLASFTTDVAGVAVLTAPADNSWQTTATPTLSGSTSGGDNATAYRIIVYESNGTTVHWDSGDVSQASSTTFSRVYNGPALVGGNDYLWKARYTKSTGVVGSYSSTRAFHVNAAPSVPTQLFPIPGNIFSNLTPTFQAYFNDLDKASLGDYPSSWVIEIRRNSDDVLIQQKTLSTNLVTGLNTYVWGTNTGGADTGLSYNIDYKWRTWFVDSKSVTGAASSYQIFRSGQAPSASITSPSNGSNISTTRPTVTWTFTGQNGKTQLGFFLDVWRNSNGVRVYSSGFKVSSVASFQVPTGYLQNNGEGYTIALVTVDTDGLFSATSLSSVTLLLAAPPRIEGLSATVYEDESRIRLDWDPSALGSNFVTYVIYRKNLGDSEWTMIGTTKPESNVVFDDWYAGQQRPYQYRVTVVKLISNEPDVESPDSDIVSTMLISDVWFVVGADRSKTHIFELPVDDESHNRPVQTEEFEPIGLNRKAVVRGFVLGHEGTMHVTWMADEAQTAKSKIEYLLYYSGPHILKNPFGDVFDVAFVSPDYKYIAGGHLTADLTWIETGATNNPGLTPDQFLASIGAQ